MGSDQRDREWREGRKDFSMLLNYLPGSMANAIAADLSASESAANYDAVVATHDAAAAATR